MAQQETGPLQGVIQEFIERFNVSRDVAVVATSRFMETLLRHEGNQDSALLNFAEIFLDDLRDGASWTEESVEAELRAGITRWTEAYERAVAAKHDPATVLSIDCNITMKQAWAYLDIVKQFTAGVPIEQILRTVIEETKAGTAAELLATLDK
jgi:hypothetical protein